MCTFEKHGPEISAFDIHEWIYEQLQLEEHEVATIQIDGRGIEVCFKFTQATLLDALLRCTNGTMLYDLGSNELSRVDIILLA
jgi:hypothetical protein